MTKEQLKEVARQYLEGEITAPSCLMEMLNRLYVSIDQEASVKWLCEQILIVR